LRNRDLVEESPGLLSIQANGLLISDEMHLVVAVGELNAKLSADNAAASVGWVTGYAYFHYYLSLRSTPLASLPWLRSFCACLRPARQPQASRAGVRTIPCRFAPHRLRVFPGSGPSAPVCGPLGSLRPRALACAPSLIASLHTACESS